MQNEPESGLDLDFSTLSDEQLRWLHNHTADLLNDRRDERLEQAMRAFRFGDAVWFEHSRGRDGRVQARVQKTNRKTVSVVDEDGGRWNVAPTLLHHAEPAREVTPREAITGRRGPAAPGLAAPGRAGPGRGGMSFDEVRSAMRRHGIDPGLMERLLPGPPADEAEPPALPEAPAPSSTPTPPPAAVTPKPHPPARNKRKKKRRR